MTQINQAEIEVYRGEAQTLETQATQFLIATPIDNSKAMEFKAALKAKLKVVTQTKEKITKPLNEALRNTREMFAPIEAQLSYADNIIGAKLLTYKRDMEAEAQQAAAQIAKKVESGRMRLDTAEKKMDAIEETKVEKTTHTDHGTVQFRKIKRVRVTEPGKVPGIYWQLNEVLIRKDALAGMQIPGVEVYEEERV